LSLSIIEANPSLREEPNVCRSSRSAPAARQNLYFSPVFGLYQSPALLQPLDKDSRRALREGTPRGRTGLTQQWPGETVTMKILEYDARGATLRLDQRELLLVMALVQEGRTSFGCDTESGLALDQLFSSANILVEQARRDDLRQTMQQQKISTVVAPGAELQKDAS
jgi:hypothetical protein